MRILEADVAVRVIVDVREDVWNLQKKKKTEDPYQFGPDLVKKEETDQHVLTIQTFLIFKLTSLAWMVLFPDGSYLLAGDVDLVFDANGAIVADGKDVVVDYVKVIAVRMENLDVAAQDIDVEDTAGMTVESVAVEGVEAKDSAALVDDLDVAFQDVDVVDVTHNCVGDAVAGD
ncbi:unnamed protein product [Caenorhabditis nigoni]